MESLPARVSSSGGGARERAGDKGRSYLSEGHLHGTSHLGCDTKAHPEAGLEIQQLSAGLKSCNLLMSLLHQQGHSLKPLVGVFSLRDTLCNQLSAGLVLLITTLETS